MKIHDQHWGSLRRIKTDLEYIQPGIGPPRLDRNSSNNEEATDPEDMGGTVQPSWAGVAQDVEDTLIEMIDARVDMKEHFIP